MRTPSKTAINVLVISASSIVLILSILFYLDFSRTLLIFPKSKQQVNSEVKTLFEQIPLNADKDEVLNLIHKQIDDKKFHVNDNNSFIQVISPYDYSFTWSWTILIFFDKNSSIGVAIRPIDGSNYWFCDAPSDKGSIPNNFKTNGKCIN